MEELNVYIARSIIRHLNGDYKEFNRLKNKALEIHKEEEYKRSCICTLEELIDGETKREMRRLIC